MQIKDTKDLEFKETLLEKTLFGSDSRVSVELSHEQLLLEARYRLLKLREEVWSQKIQNEKVELSIQTPSSWWQHFKLDCFPKWALRKWPVMSYTFFKSYEFKTVALFPDFKYTAPPNVGKLVLKTMVNEMSND